MKPVHKYYRKAEREESWFGKGKFELRFPSLTDSFMNKCFCHMFCLALKVFPQTKNLGVPTNQK